ncbi:MAG TPA: hypothetical protein PLJ21_08515 [Pseudobdellovibrionaceae bacterium]|nr:hypothetical protein [Pseudobdellovibrionaceae bacterium]
MSIQTIFKLLTSSVSTFGIFILFSTSSAQAYLTVGESAEILPASEYRFGFEPQLFLNEGGGGNLGAFFESQVSDSSSTRVGLSTGKVDFSLFGSFKFVPFPDVDKQPAIGGRVGLGYSRLGADNLFQFQVAPLVSKKTQTVEKLGEVVTYFALPFTMTTGKGEGYVASNMTFGLEVTPPTESVFYWSAEVSFNLNRSYSYISGNIIIPIDSHRGQ